MMAKKKAAKRAATRRLAKPRKPRADTVEVRSIEDFLGWVNEHCTTGAWLFRGQRVDKPLLPKIYRESPLRRGFLSHERRLLERFTRAAVPYLHGSPENEWDWLSLAQHHGLPTRLLDWSRSPLAALWFASAENGCSEGERDADSVVWAFRVETFDQVVLTDERFLPHTSLRGLVTRSPLAVKGIKIFRPRHIASRISSQSGWFTVHPFDVIPGTEGAGPRVRAMEEDPRYAKRMTKLVIRRSEDRKLLMRLRNRLFVLGIHQHTLFPDLDGLCGHLGWRHSFWRDEAN